MSSSTTSFWVDRVNKLLFACTKINRTTMWKKNNYIKTIKINKMHNVYMISQVVNICPLMALTGCSTAINWTPLTTEWPFLPCFSKYTSFIFFPITFFTLVCYHLWPFMMFLTHINNVKILDFGCINVLLFFQGNKG